MKTIHGSIPALLALSLVSGCVSLPTTDPVELPSGQWTLDPRHNSVIWQVQHLGLSWYTARFDRAEARLDFDPANPEVAQLTAIVDTDSVSTGDRDFDETLRGRTWLDTGRYPQIVFQSTHIEVTGETTGRVHGTVTLKDVAGYNH